LQALFLNFLEKNLVTVNSFNLVLILWGRFSFKVEQSIFRGLLEGIIIEAAHIVKVSPPKVKARLDRFMKATERDGVLVDARVFGVEKEIGDRANSGQHVKE